MTTVSVHQTSAIEKPDSVYRMLKLDTGWASSIKQSIIQH